MQAGAWRDAATEQVDYTRGDYAVALMKGRTDPQATEAMLQQVTRMTGLDPAYVRRSGGRLETQAYLRDVFLDKGELGSRYDSNVTAFDPFPNDAEQRTNDPLLDSSIAPPPPPRWWTSSPAWLAGGSMRNIARSTTT